MRPLSNEHISYLQNLRHDLHRQPEISGQEEQTAARIVRELVLAGADQIWENLGGHGVAAAFQGASAGPTVLIRCELDGLPIAEDSTLPYRSQIGGTGHLCGHDGHMCMVMGVALAKRPASGRVILLFQPAEETGFGAQAVIDDPRWPEIRPDYAFAYHNVPGRPMGEIGLRDGPANCASRGMQILLHGKSSHAAAPEDGLSPATAMAQLMQRLPALGSGTISDVDFGLSTLTHARLGEATFGIAPGEGELRVTLRSMTDARMMHLINEAQKLIETVAGPLKVDVQWHDVFTTVMNDPQATDIARKAAHTDGMPVFEMDHPMRWSEDFGRFGQDGAQATMLFLGSGENQPQLHNPDYDFPDELLPIGTVLFLTIIDQILSADAG
ncbi:amidohydrolase [Sulfitobacter undariae]|uniref:Amidohydrolase n=1 Tax=Sulfitobacter undariae TaxID=1563671 RepID=A0A7W6E588_9RHOB|nr:amidohydrolase [Sulfitobacter undariae]MBB3994973.1 amidohydrolase [Sulfitobacter undariae]